MRPCPRNLSLVLVAAALALASRAHAVMRTEAEQQPAPAQAIAAARALGPVAARVRLEEPSPAEAQRRSQDPAERRAQIGFPRGVAELRTAGDVQRQLAWTPLGAGRQAAAMAITSPGASALRIALRMGAVPGGTRFRFAAPGKIPLEVEASEIEATIARNVYFGDDSPGAHLYWSPVIEGDTAVLEVEIPQGAAAADLHVAVPVLSHLVTTAAQGFAMACGDAACDDDAGAADGAAAARIVFTEDGATFACSGMLVADRDPETVIPYFLTARHCIASQGAASTLQPYWPRGGAACTRDAALEPGVPGATFLHGDGDADLALVRLQHAPPQGASYAGWSVGAERSAAREGDLVKVALAAPAGASARLGQCAVGTRTSARFEAAYNAGLYQWLGGTPQDAAEGDAGGS